MLPAAFLALVEPLVRLLALVSLGETASFTGSSGNLARQHELDSQKLIPSLLFVDLSDLVGRRDDVSRQGRQLERGARAHFELPFVALAYLVGEWIVP